MRKIALRVSEKSRSTDGCGDVGWKVCGAGLRCTLSGTVQYRVSRALYTTSSLALYLTVLMQKIRRTTPIYCRTLALRVRSMAVGYGLGAGVGRCSITQRQITNAM